MDKLKSKLKCQTHPNNKVIYIQINEIKENQSPFYCEVCTSNDFHFKPQNFIRIKQILESDLNSVIQNWPPLQNDQTQKDLTELSFSSKHNQFVEQIYNFFDEVKLLLYKSLDECQKRMINNCEQLFNIEQQIKEKYSEISEIKKLKEIFQQNGNDMEGEYKDFLKIFINQKQSNTKLFEELFIKKSNIEQTYSINRPNQLKDEILSLINKINFFTANNVEQIISINKTYEQKKSQFFNLEFIKVTEQSRISESQEMENIRNKQIYYQPCKEYFSFYSSIILEKKKNYFIRFKVKQSDILESNRCDFGLIPDIQKSSDSSTLTFTIQINKQNIMTVYSNNKDTYLKGDFKNLLKDTELELKVCLDQNILEIYDIPKNNHLKKECQEDITKYKDFRFYLYLQDKIDVLITYVFVE